MQNTRTMHEAHVIDAALLVGVSGGGQETYAERGVRYGRSLGQDILGPLGFPNVGREVGTDIGRWLARRMQSARESFLGEKRDYGDFGTNTTVIKKNQ